MSLTSIAGRAVPVPRRLLVLLIAALLALLVWNVSLLAAGRQNAAPAVADTRPLCSEWEAAYFDGFGPAKPCR